MENIHDIQLNLDEIKVIKKVNPNFINAEEISKKYGLNKFFIMKMQKEYGPEWVYQCFLETEKADFPHKPGLFINKVRNIKLV